jgi:hypothetical protein
MAAIITFEPDRSTEPDRSACETSPVPARSMRPSDGISAEVYRRRRLAVVAVLVGLILGMMSWGRSADAARTPAAEDAQSITYLVQPGDTLWTIALDLAPGEDPRPLVDALDEISGGALLQPGQRLVIPDHLVD